MLRSPNAWPEAMRDFRQLYGTDASADLVRTPILWRVGAPTEDPRTSWTLATTEGPVPFHMRVWRLEAPAGSPCLMTFDASPVPVRDQGTGVLVGEVGVNAVFCIESDDPDVPIIWPVYNPIVPVRRWPKPDTSDA